MCENVKIEIFFHYLEDTLYDTTWLKPARSVEANGFLKPPKEYIICARSVIRK